MAVASISDMRILSILPKDEGFSPDAFGAIALCVRDFTLHSAYGPATTVTSGVQRKGFTGITFRPAPPARWYESRTRAYARHTLRLMRQERTQLAEIHNRPLLLRLLGGRAPCPLALHLHNDPQEMKYARTPHERATLLRECAGVYCVSEFIRQRFLEGLNEEHTGKVRVVPNGVALPDTLPPKEKLIVFAGRMTEGKGALPLAHALATALPQMPGWNAVLIGSDRHSAAAQITPRETAILEALRPAGTQAKMLGFLSYEATLSYFARAEIAVVPSVWQEPFGRTAIEALAYGCALVSSGRGALKEVTGDAALTVPDPTPQALSAALLALAGDAAQRLQWQVKARARAEDFSIAKCAMTLDNTRDRFLAEGQPNA